MINLRTSGQHRYWATSGRPLVFTATRHVNHRILHLSRDRSSNNSANHPRVADIRIIQHRVPSAQDITSRVSLSLGKDVDNSINQQSWTILQELTQPPSLFDAKPKKGDLEGSISQSILEAEQAQETAKQIVTNLKHKRKQIHELTEKMPMSFSTIAAILSILPKRLFVATRSSDF